MSRDQENGLHQLELEERDLVNKLRDKDRFEEDMEKMRQEIATYLGQLKVRRCQEGNCKNQPLTKITGNRWQDFGSPGPDNCFTRRPSTCAAGSEPEDQ